MVEVKGSTKRGQNLIDMGSRWEADYLYQIYDSWSPAKQYAFDNCRDEYYASDNHEAWGICSHNTFGFTCSWECIVEGERVLRIETPKTSYLVWLDR